MITKEQLAKGISYEDFISLNQTLLKEGKTTGLLQDAEHVEFGRINLTRMARLDKTIKLQDQLLENLSRLKTHHSIVVITEGWCGDSAQNAPIFALLPKHTQQLSVLFLIRDEHPELMDQYLTKGSRSIPKIICFETESLTEKWVWGPRPKKLQTEVEQMVAKGLSKEERGLFTQNWYNQNKTEELQNEINTLVQSLL